MNNPNNSFSEKQSDILNKLNDFISEYENFIKNVSPKNWRTTGTHYTNLLQMKSDIKSFKEITEKEKQLDWVKKQLE